jgi:hypothetical protein
VRINSSEDNSGYKLGRRGGMNYGLEDSQINLKFKDSSDAINSNAKECKREG